MPTRQATPGRHAVGVIAKVIATPALDLKSGITMHIRLLAKTEAQPVGEVTIPLLLE